MYVVTVGEIAQRERVHYSTVGGWVRTWDAGSDHSFPEPVARVQTPTSHGGWTRHQLAYSPQDVTAWLDGLAEAQKRRRVTNRQARPVVAMVDQRPLQDALVKIRELRAELAQMQTRVGGSSIDWDNDF